MVFYHWKSCLKGKIRDGFHMVPPWHLSSTNAFGGFKSGPPMSEQSDDRQFNRFGVRLGAMFSNTRYGKCSWHWHSYTACGTCSISCGNVQNLKLTESGFPQPVQCYHFRKWRWCQPYPLDAQTHVVVSNEWVEWVECTHLACQSISIQ